MNKLQRSMAKSTWMITTVICCYFYNAHASTITINYSMNDVKKLPRFWANTGFAPPLPLENVADFFETEDSKLNLEIIGSLPNNGLRNVRIHWLLNLLSISDSPKAPTYNFQKLDDFLDKLINEYKLQPTIEFMITKLDRKFMTQSSWENLAYEIISRYSARYGIKNVSEWKFETWNEPDLKGFNILNFTRSDYFEYIHGIKRGLEAANRDFPEHSLKLRGPAGLFKNTRKHPFCWGVLEKCNRNIKACPIDIITYHRKGKGNDASEIVEGSLDLMRDFSSKFPKLSHMKFANSEADPIALWSWPRDFQADTRYASILVETILQHWQAIYDGRLGNLESISHDNSFLNYYPHVFTQRTLLARFQMNNTKPKHVQYIQKPVFSALGLTSYLGEYASEVKAIDNISYTVSGNKNQSEKFYACILLASHVNLKIFSNKTKNYEINVVNLPERDDLFYFVEGIDNKRTNPSKIYEAFNKPPFPEYRIFDEMRRSQNPMIIEQPTKVVNGKIFINTQLMEPFVIAVRICSKNIKTPKSAFNLRVRRINPQEVILFWSDLNYRKRCIHGYEIFFKDQSSFIQLETGHIPFLYHQLKHTAPGCFKVRSKDIFNRYSKFSESICIS